MDARARRRFGRYYKRQRERMGLTQAAVLNRLAACRGTVLEGSALSKIEAGHRVTLDYPLAADLVSVLGCDVVRARALLVAAGFMPIPARGWDECLALAYLATTLSPEALQQYSAQARRLLAEGAGQAGNATAATAAGQAGNATAATAAGQACHMTISEDARRDQAPPSEARRSTPTSA